MTGHGLDAAAATSRARESIVAIAFETSDPAVVLRKVNELLYHRQAPIMTAIYGTIDVETLDVKYASAGHLAPILASPREIAVLGDYGGLPLGIERQTTYDTQYLSAHAGSIFVLYTDGMIEFDRDVLQGEDRLLRAARGAAERHAGSPSREIMRDVLGNKSARDDIAILTIKFLGEPTVVTTGTSRRWTFDVADPEAATRLRHLVMRTIADRRTLVDCDEPATELVLGELLSNVVRHTPGAISVERRWDARPCVLTVEDEASGFTLRPELPKGIYSESGRGMGLISALARRATVEPRRGGGSRVRIELLERDPGGDSRSDRGTATLERAT